MLGRFLTLKLKGFVFLFKYRMHIHFFHCMSLMLIFNLFQEDIIGKLIEFLIAPHATTTVLLAEKEKVHFPPPDCKRT